MSLVLVEDEINACCRRIEAIRLMSEAICGIDEVAGLALMQVVDDLSDDMKIVSEGISIEIRGAKV